MGLRDVERVEIPVLSRYFVRFVNVETHTFETVFDLHKRPSNRVEMVSGVFRNRQSHILEFVREPVGDELVLDNRKLCFKSRSNTNLTFVDSFSDGFLVLIGEVFYSLQEFGQRTILPENGVTKVNKRGFRSESGDLNKRVLFESLKSLEHKTLI